MTTLMSRRARWLTAAAIVVIALVLGLGWVGRRRTYQTAVSAEARLDSAGIRSGASAAEVLAALDSLHATHSGVGRDGVLQVHLGRSFQDLFVRGDLFAHLQFDSTGRLVARQVREALTGP